MAFYYFLVQPNVDMVVFNNPSNNVQEVFVTSEDLHRRAFVGQITSRFSTDFTSASAGE
jgi:hypothetical protein